MSFLWTPKVHVGTTGVDGDQQIGENQEPLQRKGTLIPFYCVWETNQTMSFWADAESPALGPMGAKVLETWFHGSVLPDWGCLWPSLGRLRQVSGRYASVQIYHIGRHPAHLAAPARKKARKEFWVSGSWLASLNPNWLYAQSCRRDGLSQTDPPGWIQGPNSSSHLKKSSQLELHFLPRVKTPFVWGQKTKTVGSS
jgi:hypothetical protein